MLRGLPNALGMLVGLGLAVSILLSAPASAQTIGEVSSGQVSPSQDSSGRDSSSQDSSSHVWPGQGSSSAATGAPLAAHSNAYSPRNHFFVEFRARNAASYGHVYVMYGEANARHEVIRSEIAGLGPAGDAANCVNCSIYNWTIGHLVPVPGEIGATDGDLEEQYVLTRYRIWVDAAQYQRLVAYIKERKADKTRWHAMFNNCVMFGRDVAAFLNLNVPPFFDFSRGFIPYPKTAVEALRDANNGEKDQAPLKDAPGSLLVEIASKAHSKHQQTAQMAPAGTHQVRNDGDADKPGLASAH
jgi:hypothetical protein